MNVFRIEPKTSCEDCQKKLTSRFFTSRHYPRKCIDCVESRRQEWLQQLETNYQRRKVLVESYAAEDAKRLALRKTA